RHPLTIGAAANQRLVGGKGRGGDRAGRADGRRQIRPSEVLTDAFERREIERLVLDDRAADDAAELFAVELVERIAVGAVRSQRGDPLIMEQAAPDLVRARLGDDVDDAAARAAEFGAGAGRHDLKLLDGLERDVDRRALPAHLLAEETVVVVAAVEADVVEDAALPGERDLVAVRTLDDADARRQREQILELAPQNRRGLDRRLVQRAGRA